MKELRSLEDAKVFKRKPKNWEHMLPVEAYEDSVGNLIIRFDDDKEIFAQIDYDIDAFMDNLVYVEDMDSYYILDEYRDIAR